MGRMDKKGRVGTLELRQAEGADSTSDERLVSPGARNTPEVT